MIKKLFLAFILASASTCCAAQVTNSFTLSVGQTTNLGTIQAGKIGIGSFSVTSSSTNTASLTFIDSPTSNIAYILPSTTNTIQLATNWAITYTNGDGSVYSSSQSTTYPMKQVFPAVTNLYQAVFPIYTLTNQTVGPFLGGVVIFQNGVTVSNTGLGPITVSLVTSNAP